MAKQLDLPPHYRQQLELLLQKHLPRVEVWAYGSRVNGRSHDGSDLDLVLRSPDLQPIPVDSLASFSEALRASPIPFLVAAHDWARLPESCHPEIEREHLVLVAADSRPLDQQNSDIGNGWCETTLGDITDFLSGGTPSKSRPDYWNGSVPWVSAKDMKRFRLHDTEDHVTAEGIANGTKLVPADTVLLLVRGMTLLKELPVCVTGRPMTFNQDIKALRPKPGVDLAFLPYLVLSHKRRLLRLVDLAGHGTGRLNSEELKSLKVRLPPEDEQRTIAQILGSFDDKIELNRQLNETLEELVRAIFKDWFVDFGPVRAKLEGRDTGLPEHLAELFPDRLVESELGGIPEGWGVKTLGELIDLAYGKALKADDRKGGTIPVYGSNGQIGWHDKELVVGPGIVVGRKGNPGIVTWAHSDFFPIDTAFYVVPRDAGQKLPFLFFALAAQDLPSIAADSAVPGLSRKLAYMNRQVVPDKVLVDEFSGYADTIFARRHRLEEESRTLIALRDTLLPKLVSGELRLMQF